MALECDLGMIVGVALKHRFPSLFLVAGGERWGSGGRNRMGERSPCVGF